jgi:hypothetical protein
MLNDILYEKERVKVTYLHSPELGKEDEVISGEDHELWIKDLKGEWKRYIIQRGILKDLSRVANDKSKLVDMLNRINPYVLNDMERDRISLQEVGQAVLGAYQKEEQDFEGYLAEQKKI